MGQQEKSRLHNRPINPGDEQRPDVTQTGETLCWDCKGSGRLDDRECPTCRGSGRVIVSVGDA
jgi:DnaJ-class molecular chaperone